MDIVSLLRLNIRRSGGGRVYADCPLCGDRRGRLSILPSENVWRCHHCGEHGGMLALYGKVFSVDNSTAYREICDTLLDSGFAPAYQTAGQTAPATVQEVSQAEKASADEIHLTFSALLSMLTLNSAHREHLRTVRGLTDEQIKGYGFKSTPPPRMCRALTQQLIQWGYTVQGIPGFYINDYGKWTVKFYQRTSGIIIPLREIDGLIHGLQIRLDTPIKDKDDPPEKVGAKYLPLTSSGKQMGTGSGSPVHFVGDPCAHAVYVTEGALKADICHALTGRTFVATIGANNVAPLNNLFYLLKQNGVQEIVEADDMDKFHIMNLIYFLLRHWKAPVFRPFSSRTPDWTGLGLRWTALSASWMRSTGSSLVTSWKMTLQMLSITMSVRLRLTGSTSIPALPVIPFPAWLRFGERRKFIERENAYQSICR